jgi:restriction system protein
MEILAHPVLLGLVIGLLTGLIASFLFGLWRPGGSEATAGLQALCGLKWRDFSHLVEDLLRERGFKSGDEERRPGEGGFDLMMTRGTSQYLVECKNSATHRVTVASLSDLAGLVAHQGAEGAVLATTGNVEPAALALAPSRRVELIAGTELWRQIKPWIPPELRDEIQLRARTAFARRAAGSLAIALAAGVACGAIAASLRGPAATVTAADNATARAPQPPIAVPTATPPAALGIPAAMPDASLTEDQLAARRASAALELRGNPTVQNAIWATKSTLVVTLHQAGVAVPDSMFDEACRVLVQYEELRYTRVQVESPALDAAATPNVRWRQCR